MTLAVRIAFSEAFPSLLVEAAGNLSYGIHFFFKFNAQWEEINSLSGLVRRSCGRKNYRISIVHERMHRSACASPDTAHINCQGSSCQFH